MIAVLKQRLHKYYRKSKLDRNEELTEYYFGYGANLDFNRFRKLGINAQEIGSGRLLSHKINFSLATEYLGKSYAGVHQSDKDFVPGVVVKMSPKSLNYLDSLEWCGFGAYEREMKKIEIGGKIIDCWVYIVKNPDFKRLPSKIYLENMIKAAKKKEFPDSYVAMLEAQAFGEHFPIDHTFSLVTYSSSRPKSKVLRPFLIVHDKLRDKLCSLI